MGHNLTCMGNITEMFAPSRGFGGWAIERRQTNSTTTDPFCHGNKIWDKNRYNLGCVRDISEIFSSNRGFFGVKLSNDVREILKRQTPVTRQRNFGQNGP